MNLLASIKKIRSLVKPGLIALIPVFLGCDSATDPGTEFDLGTNIDVKSFELTLPATNIYVDSLRTDGENRVLVGSYSDPLIGTVTSEGYFQYSFSSGTLPIQTQTAGSPNPQDTLFFDSAYIELQPSSLLPRGSSSDLAFDIMQLNDTLTDGLIYLASRKAELTPIPIAIGSFDKNVNILRDTLYRIKLDDSFGRGLFNATSDVTKDSARSLRGNIVQPAHKFKDLGLIPRSSSQAIANIDFESINSQIKLYMSSADGSSDSVYTAFFDINGASYSHIVRDRSGSEFDAIVENQNFDLADNKTLVDPLAGITTVFSLDGIEEFFEDNPNIIINTIILDLEGQFISRDTLESFRFHFREKNGGFFGPGVSFEQFSHMMMTDEGYLSSLSQPSIATFDNVLERYSVNPILFFQTIYNNYHSSDNREVIYINPIQGDTIQISELVLVNTSDVTLQQAQFSNSSIKLRVFYTEVN